MVEPTPVVEPAPVSKPASDDAQEVAMVLVSDIIEDVINSTTLEPSVASVVFDTFQDFMTPSVDDPSKPATESAKPETDLSSIPEQEPAVVPPETPSPRDSVVSEKQPSPTRTSAQDDAAKLAPAVSEQDTSISVPSKLSNDTSSSETLKSPSDADEAKTITFSGKTVPETGSVVVNGFAVPPQDDKPTANNVSTPAPKAEMDTKDASDTKVPAPSVSPVPQTDLDTLEDEGLDQRSDTGSVHTVDSMDVTPESGDRSSDAPVTRRVKKGNLRQRNVSLSNSLR